MGGVAGSLWDKRGPSGRTLPWSLCVICSAMGLFGASATPLRAQIGPAPGEGGGASSGTLGGAATASPQGGAASETAPGLPTSLTGGVAWRLIPAITVGESYNDNVNLTPKGGSAAHDFITTIQPSLNLTGDTPRIKLGITYSPQELIFARGTAADQLQQQLLATGTAILWPEILFFDGNASISQAFISNTAPVGATTLTGSNNLQTVEAVNASPYVRQHLGPYADSESRYRFGYLAVDANTTAPERTMELLQKFTSGDYFGRLTWTATADYQRIDRLAGTLDPLTGTSSKDELFRADFQYPIYQSLSAVGGVGWERITDPTLAIAPKGIIWNAGLKYQPNERLSAAVTYGERFGQTDIEVHASYNVGPQTRITALYTEQLQTSLSQIANNLNNNLGLVQIGTNPQGQPLFINTQTGLPFTPNNVVPGQVFNNSPFGISSGAFLQTRAEVDLEATRDRNTFFASVYDVRQSAQQTIAGVVSANSHIDGATGSWTRQLWPDLRSIVSATYYHTQFQDGTGRIDDTYTFSLGVNYDLSPTMGVQFTATRSDNRSNLAGNSISDDIATVSIRKQF